ncbi:MAG: hypothetical protein NWF00_03025 [Candidatus Bathyarchaeota archaeon]|nr:hypothetical protein [Candidatus Bathyarchaeota archaeon]
MGKIIAGFDSALFKREIIESPGKKFEAFMAAAMTIEDENEFRKVFFQAMKDIFEKHGTKRLKDIYKGYHFCFQEKDGATPMMGELLEVVAEKILRIDLYCGYYDLPEISIFGDSAGQVIKRSTFIEKYQHAFHHVCAWKYSMNYGLEFKFKLDNFEGHSTPAWENLTSQGTKPRMCYPKGAMPKNPQQNHLTKNCI